MSKFSNQLKPNIWWMVLLLVPFVGALASVFNHNDPWGVPFVFGHQFLWIAFGALVAALAYAKVAPRVQPIRRRHPAHNRE